MTLAHGMPFSYLIHRNVCIQCQEKRGRLEGKRAIPSLEIYLNFLDTRITILESTVSFSTLATPQVQSSHQNSQLKMHNNSVGFVNRDHATERVNAFYILKAEFKCLICKNKHLSNRCDELHRMSVKERRDAVHKSGVCLNCLQSHVVSNCPFMPTCKKCNHTLLHEEKRTMLLNQAEIVSNDESILENAADQISLVSAEHFYHISNDSSTILATALIPVFRNGRTVILRALIDQGSTVNLITNRARQTLNLPQIQADTPMTGVSNSPIGLASVKTSFSFGSIHDATYRYDVESIVVKIISDTQEIDLAIVSKWRHIKHLSLADSRVFEANKIDVLLGASAYAEIVLSGIKKGQSNEPIAQNTKLGWIVFGSDYEDDSVKTIYNAINETQLNNPSIDLAAQLKRVWQCEDAKQTKFLAPVQQAAKSSKVARYCLPHHPVVKESSTTTKIRTVFDASAKTNKGMSLTDILYFGLTVQSYLFDQLVSWRRLRYAFSGNIEKMYRQVKVNIEHALFQCISAINPEIKQIGTYSVPFQAIRAIDEGSKRVEVENPKLHTTIQSNLYVEDYFSSANNTDEQQITNQLVEYVFHLGHWKSNGVHILSEVKSTIDFDANFQIIGLMW